VKGLETKVAALTVKLNKLNDELKLFDGEAKGSRKKITDVTKKRDTASTTLAKSLADLENAIDELSRLEAAEFKRVNDLNNLTTEMYGLSSYEGLNVDTSMQQ